MRYFYVNSGFFEIPIVFVLISLPQNPQHSQQTYINETDDSRIPNTDYDCDQRCM